MSTSCVDIVQGRTGIRDGPEKGSRQSAGYMWGNSFRASGRTSLLDGVSIASLCVAVFAATQFPTVPGGDSGELIVASCSLGIPHPPGYPLHTVRHMRLA